MSDSKAYPLNYGVMEEITKAFSKASADSNSALLEMWNLEREREELKKAK